MFKKEYLFVFIIAGLAIAYAFFSLLVYITKGRWSRAIKKKLTLGAMIITFSAFLSGQTVFAQETPAPTPMCYEPTIAPTIEPTITPTPEPTLPPPTCYVPPPSGEVSVVPQSGTVILNSQFTTNVYVMSPYELVAAYGIEITFDQSIIGVNSQIGTKGVEAGPDGFVAAVNDTEPGKLIISGFDINGTGPGTNLHLLTIHWDALQTGTSALDLTIDKLVNPETMTIGFPRDVDSSVTVVEGILGDVDSNRSVDIIDALLVAQHYVGLNPQNFNEAMADVDKSGEIDIIDALLISQKYVGLIDEFPES